MTAAEIQPPLAGDAPSEASPELAAAEAHTRAVVLASGTSFYWGMRLLPAARRRAMFAIYAFCREVDDIADGPASPAHKQTDLDVWRAEIEALFAGCPRRLTTVALAGPVERFDLPRAEFDAMIDGMEMDARGQMRAPAEADLTRYCRRVAGAVGMLSIRVFGAHEGDADAAAEHGAVALGEALQLTNILRDLHEDAGLGRLYLPHELLERYGIAIADPDAVLADPRLPEVCAALARRSIGRFEAAERHFVGVDRRKLRPALVMMHVYRRILDRLTERGWQRLDEPVRLPKTERVWLALRHGLL